MILSNLREGVNCAGKVVALEDDDAAKAMGNAERDEKFGIV